MSLPTPDSLQRRELLRLMSLLSLPGSVALSACGGGGDAAPVPPPPPPPAPGVSGPAWFGFGRDAQHSGLGAIATQDLSRIAWQTPVDLAPQYQAGGSLLIHYGSPVVSSNNTVMVPVKTGPTGGFRFEARSGTNGGLIWQATSDYLLPPTTAWVPSYNLALDASNRLYAPGAGGKLLLRDNVDSASGTLRNAVFYRAAVYNANPAAFDSAVYINTPVTVDAQGNAFFGFIVTAANPANLFSGIARIGADGAGNWVRASEVANDVGISKVAMNSAPALSPDLATLYVVVNTAPAAGTVQRGYLVALNASTLAVRNRVALLDPIGATAARVSDSSTASPTVGPDGKVYIGVLENTFGTHNGRGWMLQFDAALNSAGAPGGFGWDDTASVVPAAMLPQYGGASTYLLTLKYNNYEGQGSGDGLNRMAIVDPGASQTDPISGRPIMNEVITILGPTFESGTSGPVFEWCVNTVAVDPTRRSVLVNSEDGFLYRWDLPSNSITQRIRLTSGIAESYTPTAIGADGAVYAINNAVLFSIGK